MAISSPITTRRISGAMKSFRNSIRSAKKFTNSTLKILDNKSKNQRGYIRRDKDLFEKRKDAVKRKEQTDLIEAGKSDGGKRKSGNLGALVENSTKSFLGRIMDFVSTLFIGWLEYNVPAILSYARELQSRISRVVRIGSAFVYDTIGIVSGLGNVLGAVGQNIISLDFFDKSRRVSKAFDDLNSNFDDMKKQFDEGISLVTTPLNINIDTGEQQAGFGDYYPAQPEAGGASQAGGLKPIHKQALDIISGPESGGDYNAMNNGQAGDRPGGAKRWLGKNLTDMTIGEVMMHQNEKQDLWAAGKYQIIPKTFRWAARNAGLKSNDRFSPENQDRMAIEVLKEQGIGAWTIGGSSYTERERQIVEQARRTPLEAPQAQPQRATTQFSGQAPQLPSASSIYKGQNVKSLIATSGVQYAEIGDKLGAGRNHNGVDVLVPYGTYIALRVDCEIIDYGSPNPEGYGNEMHIWVPQYQIRLKMAHLSGALITRGSIPAGKSFARVGATGRASGPHIHLEAGPRNSYKGDRDPSPYISLLLLTDSPSQPATAIRQPSRPTAAAIQAKPNTQQIAQNITPERRGSTIILTQQPPQKPKPQQSSSGGATMPFVIAQNTLNSYVNKKILLDLSYT